MRIERQKAREEPGAGYRVLVDRIWPRGLAKQQLPHDLWAKDLTPSADLRRWYHTDREARHDDFVRRYSTELTEADHDELLAQIRAGAGRHNGLVALVSDAKDVEASHVPVLEDWLRQQL